MAFPKPYQLAVSSCADIIADLIAYYPLDGSANDVVGSNHGSLSGSPFYTQGMNLGSLRLSGADDQCVNLGNAAALNPSLITISAWVKPDNASGSGVVVSRYGATETGGTSYRLRQNGSGKWEFGVNVGGWTTVTSVVSCTTDWTHLFAVYDGAVLQLYVNGSIVPPVGVIGTLATSTANTYIGADYTGDEISNEFDGDMQDVGLWSAPKDPWYAVWLYNGGRGRTWEDLPRYLLGSLDVGLTTDDDARLEIAGTNTLFDPASNNNDFTLAGEFIHGKTDDPTTALGVRVLQAKYNADGDHCSYWLGTDDAKIFVGVSKDGTPATGVTELTSASVLELGTRYRYEARYEYVADGSSVLKLVVNELKAGTSTEVVDLSTSTAVGPVHSDTLAPYFVGSRKTGTSSYQSAAAKLFWSMYRNQYTSDGDTANLMDLAVDPWELLDEDSDFFDDFQFNRIPGTNTKEWRPKLPAGQDAPYASYGTLTRSGILSEFASYWPNASEKASWYMTDGYTNPLGTGYIDMSSRVTTAQYDDYAPALNNNHFSVYFHGRFHQGSHNDGVLQKGGETSTVEYFIWKDATGKINARISSTGSDIVTLQHPTVISDDQDVRIWVVYTYVGSGNVNNLKLYVNSTTPVELANTLGPIYNGGSGTGIPRWGYMLGSANLNGQMYKAAYWNAALSQSDVEQHFSGTKKLFELHPDDLYWIDFSDVCYSQNSSTGIIRAAPPHSQQLWSAWGAPQYRNEGSPVSHRNVERKLNRVDSMGWKANNNGTFGLASTDPHMDFFRPSANNDDITYICIGVGSNNADDAVIHAGAMVWLRYSYNQAIFSINYGGTWYHAPIPATISGNYYTSAYNPILVGRFKYSGNPGVANSMLSAAISFSGGPGKAIKNVRTNVKGPVNYAGTRGVRIFGEEGYSGNRFDQSLSALAVLQRSITDQEEDDLLNRKISILDLNPDFLKIFNTDPAAEFVQGMIPDIGPDGMVFIPYGTPFTLRNSTEYTGLQNVLTYPQVSTASASDDDKVQVTFDMEVKHADPGASDDGLNPDNYAFTSTLGVPRSASSVSLVQANPTIVEITLDGEMTNGVDYKVTVSNVESLGGNLIDPSHDEYTFTGQGTQPQVSSATATADKTVRVVFDEAMLGNAALVLAANYTFNGPYSLTAVSVSVISPTTVEITTTEEMQSGGAYTVTVDTAVQDVAWNTLDPAHDEVGFSGLGASPKLLSAIPIDSEHVRLTFDSVINDASAKIERHYRITNPSGDALTIIDAQHPTDTQVVLTTSPNVSGMTYTVKVWVGIIKKLLGAYVAAVPSDIGKPVEGTASGQTGVLRAYDNASYVWQIEPDTYEDTFKTADKVIVVGGDGQIAVGASSVTTVVDMYTNPVLPPDNEAQFNGLGNTPPSIEYLPADGTENVPARHYAKVRIVDDATEFTGVNQSSIWLKLTFGSQEHYPILDGELQSGYEGYITGDPDTSEGITYAFRPSVLHRWETSTAYTMQTFAADNEGIGNSEIASFTTSSVLVCFEDNLPAPSALDTALMTPFADPNANKIRQILMLNCSNSFNNQVRARTIQHLASMTDFRTTIADIMNFSDVENIRLCERRSVLDIYTAMQPYMEHVKEALNALTMTNELRDLFRKNLASSSLIYVVNAIAAIVVRTTAE